MGPKRNGAPGISLILFCDWCEEKRHLSRLDFICFCPGVRYIV